MSQSSIYLSIEGGPKGDVTAEKFKDMIAVSSFSFNANREIQALTGVISERSSKACHLSDIHITKTQDCSTTKLLELATVGKGKDMDFHFTTQASDGIQEICKITIKDVMISSCSYDAGMGGDARLNESYTLSYTEIEMNTTQFDDDHTAQAPNRFGYSAIKGSAI